jgi:hypothetical protein
MSGDIDRRTAISVAVALVAVIAIVVVGIAVARSGGDEETSPSPAPASAPREGAPSPDVASQLPPGVAECLADQGVDLEGADINEIFHGDGVPPQVLAACFQALHEGGGAP